MACIVARPPLSACRRHLAGTAILSDKARIRHSKPQPRPAPCSAPLRPSSAAVAYPHAVVDNLVHREFGDSGDRQILIRKDQDRKRLRTMILQGATSGLADPADADYLAMASVYSIP